MIKKRYRGPNKKFEGLFEEEEMEMVSALILLILIISHQDYG